VVRHNIASRAERGDVVIPEAPNPHKAEATAVQAGPTINQEAGTSGGLI
jgi:hypothetical protein